jgi:hypothetical protein
MRNPNGDEFVDYPDDMPYNLVERKQRPELPTPLTWIDLWLENHLAVVGGVAVLILLLLALLAAAAPAKAWDGEIYLGHYFNSTYYAQSSNQTEVVARAGVNLGHDIEIWNDEDRLRFWGEIEVSIDEMVGVSTGGLFHPGGVRYFLGAEFFLVEDWLRLDFTHMCEHTSDYADMGLNEQYNLLQLTVLFGDKK